MCESNDTFFKYRLYNHSESFLVSKKRVKLNARGTCFEIPVEKFRKHASESRLGKLSKFETLSVPDILYLCDDYNTKNLEFYFDRNPAILGALLDHHETGEFHISFAMCQIQLKRKLAYWMIPPKDFKRCCKVTFLAELKERVEKIM